MATTALKKITTRAKAIRKKKPGISWNTAIKTASKEYKGGKISGVKKKKSAPRKRVGTVKKKTTRSKPKVRVGEVAMTVSQQERSLLKGLKDNLGRTLMEIDTARTKTDKKRLRKKAADIRKKIKVLC